MMERPGAMPAIDPARRTLMPNLFIIGASKAGSSALHAYLKYHPDIRMSDEKEPCFFIDQAELKAAWPIMARQPCSHDWNAYLDLFAGGEGARYRGEGSVYYSQAPHRSGVPARIAAAVPDARIVYVVREPISRTIAHYWQRAKEFQETRSLQDAVEQDPLYRDTSDYALQLSTYLETFDRSQIYVLVAEDLRSRRLETLKALFAWLGLPMPNFEEEALAERHKSPPTSRRERFPFVKQMRDSTLWAQARTLLPKAAIDQMRAMSTRKFEKANVDDRNARAWLAHYFAPRIEKFETMLGYRIQSWSFNARK